MPRTYKSARVTRPEQSVLIATPAYEIVKPAYAFSLAMTAVELTRRGVPFEIAIMEGNCHVDDGRNTMVQQFLYDTQHTEMVFIDSDVSWLPEMFMRLISHDSDNIVAGVYPYKSFPLKFPVGKILNAHEDGLLEVSYAPTGFMRIPRTVFEKLMPVTTKQGRERPTWRFFERRYTANTYDGGDVTFCRKWIAAGGQVIVDPKLTLSHSGEYRWQGCFLDYLANDENRELHTTKSTDPIPVYDPATPQYKDVQELAPEIHRPAPMLVEQPPVGTPVGKSISEATMEAFDALLSGVPTLEHFTTLANEWGNKPWAATPEYVEMAYKMAAHLPAGSRILECGSGLSTLVLSVIARRNNLSLMTLEHTDEWRDHVLRWLKTIRPDHGADVQFPMVDVSRETGWYAYTPDFAPDLIVIDGPPRYLGGDRLYPLSQSWLGGAAVLIDDASSKIIEQLDAIPGDWIATHFGGRPACVGRVGVTSQFSAA